MNKTFEKLGFYPADILLPKDQDDGFTGLGKSFRAGVLK